MEELREKLYKLIEAKGTLNEETIKVSEMLDKLLVKYYQKSN